MVTVCLQCGDEGASNAFVYCVKCLDFVVHRYCLDKLPETDDEYVRWFCEDCNPKVPNKSTLQKPSSVPSWKEDHAKPAELIHSRAKIKEKDSSGLEAERKEHRCQDGLSHQPHKKHAEIDLTEHAQLSGDDSPLKVKPKNRKEISSSVAEDNEKRCQSHLSQQPREGHRQLQTEHAKLVGDCSALKIEKKSGFTSSVAELNEQTHQSSPCQQPHEALIFDDMSKFGEHISHPAMSNLANNLAQDCRGRAQPVIDPIWRGSFSILNRNYDTFDGFVAHLSSKACQKVYREASLIPSSLCLEVFPKSELWPKSFEKSEPCDDNIALYIFPADMRDERVFDYLVDEMMRQELAMKATIENAELLVFTSTELPQLYWRFRSKYYLWGVFRGKQTSSSRPANNHRVFPNRSNIAFTHLNSPNDVGTREERDLAMTKSCNVDGPLSPLSNSRTLGSGTL